MIYDITPVNNYTGNNSTTTFEFNFYIENEEQLKVTLYDNQNIQHLLQNEVDYRINELKNKNGSYITFPLSTSEHNILSENEKISLELTLPISQETQYNNSSLLNLEALEYSFDYLTRLIQILARKQELSIKVSEFSDITPEELYNQLTSTTTVISQIEKDIIKKYEELTYIYENINKNNDKFNQIDINTNSIITLENNLENKLNENISNITTSAIEEISNWGTPDYSAGILVAITNSWTAPFNCVLSGNFNVLGQTEQRCYINGTFVGQTNNSGQIAQLLMAKGDVLTLSGSIAGTEITYCPLKGVQNE